MVRDDFMGSMRFAGEGRWTKYVRLGGASEFYERLLKRARRMLGYGDEM
jgi:hypothetical protein